MDDADVVDSGSMDGVQNIMSTMDSDSDDESSDDDDDGGNNFIPNMRPRPRL